MTCAAIIAVGAISGSVAAIWPSAVSQPSPLPPVIKQTEDIAKPEVLAPAPIGQIHTHVVLAGETLYGIAAKYQIDVDTLLSANSEAGELIRPGDQLVVLPQRGLLHVVETGDTLWGIASQYSVAAEIIRKANNKADERLFTGEKLFIPGGRHRAANAASRASVTRFVWPTAGEFSSPFGYRWGRLHAGIDIANDIGTPIRAAKAGRVLYAGWQSGYGYTIIIDHGSDCSTLYGHLNTLAVSSGQYVQTGQFIAYMGDTGNSTGSHLHFEVQVNGKPVNPMNYLN